MPSDVLELFKANEMQTERPPPETKLMKIDKKKQEKVQQAKYELDEKIHHWNPFEENLSSDPYKTLIVARLKFETAERTVKLEF